MKVVSILGDDWEDQGHRLFLGLRSYKLWTGGWTHVWPPCSDESTYSCLEHCPTSASENTILWESGPRQREILWRMMLNSTKAYWQSHNTPLVQQRNPGRTEPSQGCVPHKGTPRQPSAHPAHKTLHKSLLCLIDVWSITVGISINLLRPEDGFLFGRPCFCMYCLSDSSWNRNPSPT